MANIDHQIGQLKLAAIDAAMRQHEYVVAGESYRFLHSGVPGEVTRPGAETAVTRPHGRAR